MGLPQGSAGECHQLGLGLLEQGYREDAFEYLSRAHLLDPENPLIQSSYALGLALARDDYESAAKLAQSASKREFYNPQIHVNLASIHLAFRHKREALKALRTALKLESKNDAARQLLKSLGVRRRRVLQFLPRKHPVNRLLGRCRKAFAREAPRSASL